MSADGRAILLDTNACIWLVEGGLKADAVEAVDEAQHGGGVYVSSVSAWEIGLLGRPRPNRSPRVTFLPDPLRWFDRLLALPSVRLAPLTYAAAIGSSALPGLFHDNPGDRLLIAVARELDLPLVTRDGAILDYAREGHVQAIAC